MLATNPQSLSYNRFIIADYISEKSMRQIAYVLISLIMASWFAIIAVFSIQNIQEVSLKFLLFESIKIPIGVLLSFSLALGMVFGAILPLIFTANQPQSKRERKASTFIRQELEEIEAEDPLEDWEDVQQETW